MPIWYRTAQTKREEPIADKKVVFVAFAVEDERQRDFLKGQSLHPRAPYEFIDMSVKDAYDKDWKEKVRTRIKRSDGIIVLVSKNSLTSSGQKWEIACAKEEKKKIRSIWAYTADRTNLEGVATTVAAFLPKIIRVAMTTLSMRSPRTTCGAENRPKRFGSVLGKASH